MTQMFHILTFPGPSCQHDQIFMVQNVWYRCPACRATFLCSTTFRLFYIYFKWRGDFWIWLCGGRSATGTRLEQHFANITSFEIIAYDGQQTSKTLVLIVKQNIARIANAVQVTVCLLVSTMSTNLNLNRCLCSHCSQCPLVSTSVH